MSLTEFHQKLDKAKTEAAAARKRPTDTGARGSLAARLGRRPTPGPAKSAAPSSTVQRKTASDVVGGGSAKFADRDFPELAGSVYIPPSSASLGAWGNGADAVRRARDLPTPPPPSSRRSNGNTTYNIDDDLEIPEDDRILYESDGSVSPSAPLEGDWNDEL